MLIKAVSAVGFIISCCLLQRAVLCDLLLDTPENKNFKITDWKCMSAKSTGSTSNDASFLTLYDVSLGDCTLECDIRKKCKAVNYVSNLRMCELLSNGTFEKRQEQVPSCCFVKRSDIFTNVLKQVCNDECSEIEACDRDLRRCKVKECQPLFVDNAEVFGNMVKFGSKSKIKCHNGYLPAGGEIYTTCSSAGVWEPKLMCTNPTTATTTPTPLRTTSTSMQTTSTINTEVTTTSPTTSTALPTTTPTTSQTTSPTSTSTTPKTKPTATPTTTPTTLRITSMETNTNRNTDVTDCLDVKQFVSSKTGVYDVFHPGLQKNISVFCDMDTDNGGWTVFQYRFDGSVDFYRNLSEYEQGFGDLFGEFWMGLKYIHEMTKNTKNDVYLKFVDESNNVAFEKHEAFKVDEGPDYILHVGAQLESTDATATDLPESFSHNNLKGFSSADDSSDNCAKRKHSGWWHAQIGGCTRINPNGKYITPGSTCTGVTTDCIYVRRWKGTKSLNSTMLMFRKKT